MGHGIRHGTGRLSTSAVRRGTLRCVRRTLFLGLLALPACSKSTPSVSIDITTGQETTAFTDAAVKTVEIDVTSPIDMSLMLHQTVTLPSGTFDFGNIANTEQILVTVTGYTAEHKAVMTGQSFDGLLLSSVQGDVPVFIQQKAQWARPPGGLGCSHLGGVVTVRENSAMVVTGGTAPSSQDATKCQTSAMDAYDITTLGGVSSSAYGDVPSTIVSLPSWTDTSGNVYDSQGLFITSTGGTFWDYVLGTPSSSTCLGFSSWADVAGGAAIADNANNSGAWWVVGGTRTAGPPTDQVLNVAQTCTMSPVKLNSPRLGAAAAWIENVGLVVAGGSGDASSAGLEVLPMGSANTSFTAVPYKADPVVGGSVIGYGGGLLLVGGVDGDTAAAPRVVYPTPTCTPPCTATPVATTPALPRLRNTAAFQLSSSQALLVGTDDMGMTQTFVLDLPATGGINVTPAPLREPRRGGSAVLSPVGSVAMLGGEHPDGTPALSVELFAP
jgi:hypothetical protein